MLKGYEYNKDYRVIRGKSIYTQEYDLLHEFSATDNENIRLEYSTEREAINAKQALTKYVNRCRMPLKIIRRDVFVFAVKVARDENEEK